MNIGAIAIGYSDYLNFRPDSAQKSGPAGMSYYPDARIVPDIPPAATTSPVNPAAPYTFNENGNSLIFYNDDGDTAQLSYPFAMYNQIPETPKPVIGADFKPDKLIPEMPGSGLLDELKPDGECQTCANRKYVDGSDDASVSYQTPTSISPGMAGLAVAAHEQEHVRKERAYAERDNREVVQQSVTLHYDCCPECGKSYVSGGTTRTTTVGKSDNQPQEAQPKNQPDQQSSETE